MKKLFVLLIIGIAVFYLVDFGAYLPDGVLSFISDQVEKTKASWDELNLFFK